MKKIISAILIILTCLTISFVPVMAAEPSITHETPDVSSRSANIIFPRSKSFYTSSTITSIRYQAFATNTNGYIQLRFTNTTTGGTYNRVFVTDGNVYVNGANMAPGNYNITVVGGTYQQLMQIYFNFS